MIVIQGPVGAGKSTLARKLAENKQMHLYPEPVESNPYLEKFYEEPRTYAFLMQLFLLHSRFRQAMEAADLEHRVGIHAVMDMSIFGNDIFAELQAKSGYITESEMGVYRFASASLKQIVRPPDLMVYLQCSPSVSIQRIMKRGRSSELRAPLQYWYDLNELYEHWYVNYNESQKLCINVDQLDFVESSQDEHEILEKVLVALSNSTSNK